jgi:flavin reductase (DIM6/NTAB) family NADH-FMN oxidoreductase RutF
MNNQPSLGPEPNEFREAMATLPAGVAVVTAWDDDRKPRGATVSAICSLSIDPMLVLVCLGNDSDTGQALHEGVTFLVNILAEDQAEIARLFATKRPDKFDQVSWSVGMLGLPQIRSEGSTRIGCSTLSRSWGGDHSIIVGAVLAARTAALSRPLVHWRRRFGSFHDHPLTERIE